MFSFCILLQNYMISSLEIFSDLELFINEIFSSFTGYIENFFRGDEFQ